MQLQSEAPGLRHCTALLWPVKVIRKEVEKSIWGIGEDYKKYKETTKEHHWRGGWTSALHGYVCSRHWKEAKQQGWHTWAKKHITTQEALLAKIKEITKPKKKQWAPLR